MKYATVQDALAAAERPGHGLATASWVLLALVPVLWVLGIVMSMGLPGFSAGFALIAAIPSVLLSVAAAWSGRLWSRLAPAVILVVLYAALAATGVLASDDQHDGRPDPLPAVSVGT